MQSASLYVGIFLLLLFSMIAMGSWIGSILAMCGIVFFVFFLGVDFLQAIGPVVYNAWTSYSLVAIPMFVFMATILGASGVGERLYSGSAALFSRFAGGLLHANIMASAGFGAICGSTSATCAAISKVALPYMEKENYPEKKAMGSLLAGGGLGLMIPPSAGFIIYGMLCNQSVGQLFMAGIFPGIMLATLFSLYIAVSCKLSKEKIPTYKRSFKETVLSLLSTWPVAMLFLGLMGAIFFGVCTATEASGLGVLISVVITIVLRRFNTSMMLEALEEGTKISVMIFYIIGGGFILAAALSNLGVPQAFVHWITEANLSRIQVILLVSLMYSMLGCVLDGASAMISTLPTIFPVIVAAGFDPIWFGVVMIIYMEMAAITPPIGYNLFVVQGIT